MWGQLDETRVVAVADADADGLATAMRRLQVADGYRDYREMLDKAKPEIVAICPRHPDQHRDMALAAIAAGARGLYLEKPYCRTPAEADEISQAAARQGTKIAVAHRNRYSPVLPVLRRLIADGEIGTLLEFRGRGKGDRRGGVEDLWVLGSHVLNLVCYLGGPPTSCSAVIRQDDQPIAADDVRPGNEGLGPVAGNRLHARYELDGGGIAYYDSIADDGTRSEGFGLQVIGSEGVIDMKCDRFPLAHLIRGNPFTQPDKPRVWQPIASTGPGDPRVDQQAHQQVMQHIEPGRDLIGAIEDDRRPLCDADEAALTVEMICATFASHANHGQAVRFPLAGRGNALAELR